MVKKKVKMGPKSRMYMIIHLILLLAFLIALPISFRFDLLAVSNASVIRNLWLTNFMLWVTYTSSTLAILFILTSLFMWHEHKRRWILPLWLSLALSTALSILLKLITMRPRPYQLDGFDTLMIFVVTTAAWNSSMPSMHAAIAFSALPVLDKEFPYFKFFWLGFACLVAFSRIYFALHFLSDVLIGAALGYLVGMVCVKLEEKYNYSRLIERLWKKGKKSLR